MQRDPFSNLTFDEIQLPIDPMRGNSNPTETSDSRVGVGNLAGASSRKSSRDAVAGMKKKREKCCLRAHQLSETWEALRDSRKSGWSQNSM